MSAKQQRHFHAAQHFQRLLDQSRNKAIITFLCQVVVVKHYTLAGV